MSKFTQTETMFVGTREEYLSVIPESVIDQVIKILGIDPDAKAEQKFDYCKTRKEELWDDLSKYIRFLGQKTPTMMGAQPTKLLKHIQKLKTSLKDSVEDLKSIEYAALRGKDFGSKEHKVAKIIRQAFHKTRNNKLSTVPDSIIQEVYGGIGEWGMYHPFDCELQNAIKALEQIVLYFDCAANDLKNRIRKRGTNNPGKDKHDTLILRLCYTYKKYTGEVPRSFPKDDETATGKIIPYLQKILPHTNYGGHLTQWALQKKIERLSKNVECADIWGEQDTKN